MTTPFKLFMLMTALSLTACGDDVKQNTHANITQGATTQTTSQSIPTQPDGKQTASHQSDKSSTPDVAQERLDKGTKLWAEKKFDLAEAEFRKAIEEHPKSAGAHARLAGLLLSQNKTSEAVPVYQDAIILDPKNPKLFAALSIAYLHQSKFSMAKAMADQATQLDPGLKEAAKLTEYIDLKQKAIAQARKVTPGAVKPNDVIHGSTNGHQGMSSTNPEVNAPAHHPVK